MSLNSENLVSLKRAFVKYRNELDVFAFVSVMRQHVAHAALSHAEQLSLVANLSELFAQVRNREQRMAQ